MEYMTVEKNLDSDGNILPINFDEFYAERVASFERERTLFDRYIRLVKPENNEAHDLEWETRSLQEEARLARQAAEGVEAKLKSVQQEIQNVSKQIFEMQEAKKTREEQIARLMHLARPVGKDVTYIYKDLFSARDKSKPVKGGKTSTSPTSEQKQQESTHQIFKIIKTGEVVKLEGRVQDETLHAANSLREIKAALHETEEERVKSRLYYQLLRDEDVEEANKLWKGVDRNEFQCFHAVAELLRLRCRILVAQRQEVEELEKLQIEKEQFVFKEEEAKSQLLEEMNTLHRHAQSELQEVQRNFETQLADLDYRLVQWKSKEKKLKKVEMKVQNHELKMQEKLDKVKERYIALKKRNSLEMEGYRNQVLMLRSSLKHVEKLVAQQVQVQS